MICECLRDLFQIYSAFSPQSLVRLSRLRSGVMRGKVEGTVLPSRLVVVAWAEVWRCTCGVWFWCWR